MSPAIRPDSSIPPARTASAQAPPLPASVTVDGQGDAWLPLGRPDDRKTEQAAGKLRQGPQAIAEARADLAAHRADYQRALASLAPTDRAHAEAIEHVMATRPTGQMALARLVLAGELGQPGERSAVLAHLDQMATMPLAPGLDRASLLADTLTDLAMPNGITQGDRAACESGMTQSLMARAYPAEYTRLIAALASPAGRATTADGRGVLARPADWHARLSGVNPFIRFYHWLVGHHPVARSTTGELFQPAFANLAMAAHGPGYRYDNAHDRDRDPRGKTLWNTDHQNNGITNGELATALAAITGEPYAYTTRDLLTRHDAAERQRAARAVYRGLALGHSVPIVIDDGNPLGGHDVLAIPGNGDRIHIFNPNDGLHESMSRATFEAIVYSAIAREEAP